MKILLLGKNGQVGSALQSSLADLGELTAWDRSDLDLSVPDSIRESVRRARPDIIVNAAAYTAVDRAETESDLAMAINGAAVGIMAEEASRLNALLVHFSTDYVFDGSKFSPYTESDTTHPLNVYGRTKLAGEQAICDHAARHLIFRTTWVYDAHGKNFLNTLKRVGAQRPELAIVDDQIGAPTWSREIASATAQIIPHFLDCQDQKQISGIYHLTAQGQTSWFDFARAAAEFGLFSGLEHPPALRAIPGSDYPTPAQRPMYSVLSNEKLRKQFGIQLPDWKVSLRECLNN